MDHCLQTLASVDSPEQHRLIVGLVLFHRRLQLLNEFPHPVVALSIARLVWLLAVRDVRQLVLLLSRGLCWCSCLVLCICGSVRSLYGLGGGGLPSLVFQVYLLPFFKKQIFHLGHLLKNCGVIWCLTSRIRLVIHSGKVLANFCIDQVLCSDGLLIENLEDLERLLWFILCFGQLDAELEDFVWFNGLTCDFRPISWLWIVCTLSLYHQWWFFFKNVCSKNNY